MKMNNLGKTVLAVSLSTAMAFSFAACSTTTNEASDTNATASTTDQTTTELVIPESGTATDLVKADYMMTCIGWDSGVLKAVVWNEAENDYKLLSVEMTEEQSSEFFAIEADENGELDPYLAAYIDNAGTVTSTDINDKVPAQSDLDQYVGKTIADLEADGFSVPAVGYDENNAEYIALTNEDYTVNVYPQDTTEELSDKSDSDLETVVIGSIEFSGFCSTDNL